MTRELRGVRLSAQSEPDQDEPKPSKPKPRPAKRGGGGGSWWSRHPILRFLAKWCAVAAIWVLVVVGVVLAYLAAGLPDVRQAVELKRRPAVTLVAADGSLIARVGDFYGQTVAASELPRFLPDAVIAIEDRRFRYHWGVDPIGLARALYINWRTGATVQGGSTLTQQLAKNMFLTPERTMKRKAQEALLAMWLEHLYTKDQILTGYLNRVYLGAGAFGVDAAAKTYFGHPATELTLRESAIIAGLLKAPSRYAPTTNPEAAWDRARLVLAAMRDQGRIDEKQFAAAMAPNQPVTQRRPGVGDGVRYFADWVVDRLTGYIGPIEQDVTITTTLDGAMQRAAEQHLIATLDGPGAKARVSQGAIVAMAPDGAVKALVGGRDYQESQFNRATQAMRQPGSTFKPFVYLAALEAGLRPDSLVDDAPIRIGGWQPANYTPGFKGLVPARDALAESINTAAVRVLDYAGIERVRKLAKRVGMTEQLQPDLSLALGTSEVTLLDLVGAYAVFANGGDIATPYAILEVKDRNGTVLYKRQPSPAEQVVQPWHVAELNAMMAGVLDYGTGKAARIGRPAAGKTGTTNDYRNAWFVGFTGDLVCGVWFGNDDNSPMKRVTGGSLPAQTWRAFMQEALKDRPSRVPPGLERRPSAPPPSTLDGPAPRVVAAPTAPAPKEEEGIGGLLRRLFGG
jgi:penicillin-binding protein 1A